MLRSQSISNLSDHRKSKTGGLFGALRSKKSSMSDLHSIVAGGKKPRPLSSTGASALNLSRADYKPKLSPISHSSSAAQQRMSVSASDKENVSPSGGRYKGLKSRSSAPNLSSTSHSKPVAKAHRTSVVVGGATISKPVASEVALEQPHSRSANSSPITPETVTTVDSLLDSTSIQIYDFENTSESMDIDHDLSDTTSFTTLASSVDLDEKKPVDDLPQLSCHDLKTVNMRPRPHHRTTRLFDQEDFVKMMHSANISSDSASLPLNNRDSLKLELQQKAQLLARLHSEDDYSTSLSFLENAELLTTTTDCAHPRSSFEYSVNNIDYLSVLKDDPYNDTTEDSSLYI